MLGFSLVERLVELIQPAFLVAGYAIVAGAVLLERSILLGLIIPGDIILALGGVYAARGQLNVVLVIVIGSLAAIAGESVGFWLGRRYGMRLIRRLPLLNRLEKTLEQSEDFFRRHGGKTVAIGRYATAAGAFVPFTAGMGKMRYSRFLAFDVPAIIVWATGITLFGYLAGRNLDFIDRVLSRFGWTVLGLAVAFFAGRFLWKRYEERRGRRGSSRRSG
jgi:membrane protein DedA with SNARE-associated domain